VRKSSNSTSETDAWMGVVRSVSVVTSMPLGRLLSSCGRSALMRLTTLMVFPPGWRWTLTMTAGVFVHPGRLAGVFHAVDDFATSVSITGAPLRKATTTLR